MPAIDYKKPIYPAPKAIYPAPKAIYPALYDYFPFQIQSDYNSDLLILDDAPVSLTLTGRMK